MKTLLEKKEYIKLLISNLKSIFKRRTYGLLEKEIRTCFQNILPVTASSMIYEYRTKLIDLIIVTL